MTNQASELFELCKEVYEKTGWDDLPDWYFGNHIKGGGIQYELKINANKDVIGRDDIPLYTSDYILEKLPPSIQSKEYPGKPAFLWTRKEDDSLDKYPEGRISYFAWYFVTGIVDGVSDYGESADTPRKALLKLTLALHEAGELS